ncbi:hypothetical protein WH47_10958, partial [Habropoda laboriosa]
YSPDLYYHLFRSLCNSFNGKLFENTGHLKLTLDRSFSKSLIQVFNPKDENFFEGRIKMLPVKWQMVLANNGQYMID